MSKQTQLEAVVVVTALAYAHRYLHETIIGPIQKSGFGQMVQFATVKAAFLDAVMELAACVTSERLSKVPPAD